MVILIGGAGYAGKTLMAQRLLEKYKYPYLSIDHLKMGLFRADINCGFTPYDGVEHIGERIWPILSNMIMTNIENKQNLIVEGAYLLPRLIGQLSPEYLENIISYYILFTGEYAAKYYESRVLKYRNVIEARGYEDEYTAENYVLENRQIREMCEAHGAKYFMINDDYEAEMRVVYDWVDSVIRRV